MQHLQNPEKGQEAARNCETRQKMTKDSKHKIERNRVDK